MWILTEDGYVNTAHVVRIADRHEVGGSILHLANGDIVAVLRDMEAYEIVGRLDPLVPAPPGFELLCCDGEAIEREPIIAWRCRLNEDSEFDTPIAITPSGVRLYVPGVGVRFPDGQVFAPEWGCERTYPDVEAWLAGERKLIAERKAAAAKPKAAIAMVKSRNEESKR
jgi:hypothetical protein